ncbi:MAG: tetratricopeptide repeat protein [Myxococcota bacterium]
MACSTRSRIEALSLGLAMLLVPTHVAQAAGKKAPAKKSSAKKPDAKAAAQAGKTAYELGRFEEALAHYEEAWRLKQAPGLLFNLGQCHRQLGHSEQALHYYKQYLESDPPDAQAKATREVVAKLEKELAEAEARAKAEAEQKQALELEQARAEAARIEREREAARQEEARRAEEARLKELELQAAIAAAPPKAPPKPAYKTWWFWTGVGVVAAGTTTAILLATIPRSEPTTFQDINAR